MTGMKQRRTPIYNQLAVDTTVSTANSLVPLAEFESATFCSANMEERVFMVFRLLLAYMVHAFIEKHSIYPIKPMLLPWFIE